MSGGEVSRLAALERTLVGAAARQAQRHRQRRRRAVLLLALAAPLVLAAAASVASTHGFLGGIDQQLGSLRDDRLIARPGPASQFPAALGALPRDRASGHAWFIAGTRVTGYITPAGSLCFVFSELTGGCLQRGVLSSQRPLAAILDYGPGIFRVYGFATDDVSAVSVRVHGVTRPVLLTHNTFYFERDSLGGAGPVSGALVVRLRDGAIRTVPIGASGGERPTRKSLPSLPGALPAAITAT